MSTITDWDLPEQRSAGIAKYANPDNQERFNNCRFMTFNQWSEHPAVDRLVTNLCLMMWGHDHLKRHNQLKIILLNLLRLNTKDPTRYMAYYRQHSRYTNLIDNPAPVTRLTPLIIDNLAQERLVENHIGRYWYDLKMGYCSKTRATKRLMDIMEFYGVTPIMITNHPDTEVIILRGHRERIIRNRRLVKAKGPTIDLAMHDEVIEMHERLVNYNRFMVSVQLEYDGQVLPIGPTKRVFNDGSWDRGGRFYGGFWQHEAKNSRAKIKLNGESVTELDYSSLHARLLYNRVGVEPRGDLYDIPPIPREAAKKAVLLMIGSKRRSSVVNKLAEYIRETFPDDHLCPETIVSYLESHHPALFDLWYQGLALDLQNIDSQICDHILTTMTDDGIPCLSIHDSFLVPRRHREDLKAVMIDSFRTVTGASFEPPIDTKY